MTINNQWLLSRRALLGGLAATGLSSLLPGKLLPGNMPFRSAARAQTVPTRLIVVHVPEGMWSGAPRPAAGTSELGPILEALAPYRDQLLVLDNLNMASRDHGPGGDGHHRGVPHMFTCTEMQDESNAGGASIDQKIAGAIGGDSPFASLQFAVRIIYGDTNARPLWSGPGRVVPAMENPWDAYDRIFSGVMPTGPTMMAPPFDLRRSVLDHSLTEMTALRSRLASTDRILLDSYQESLRDIERRLGMLSGTTNSGCTLPTLGGEVDVKAESNYPMIGELQMDLMVAALQCNVTRVASLQWGNSNDQCSYSWLGVNTLGHDMAHNNDNCDPDGSKKLTTTRWYSEQFAYLLGKLSSVQEGAGTMLDNTVVLWASEFSDSNGHNADRLMWMLMGNANGYFRQGRNLNCNGRSVSDLHTSLGNAFGITDTSFGNPAYCDGPLADLT